MRHLKKFNENKNQWHDIDWELINDSLIDSFDYINNKVLFHFYSYLNYSDEKFYDFYNNYTDKPTSELNIESLKKENTDHPRGQRYKENGSFLYGVDINFFIPIIKVEEIEDINKNVEYFNKCYKLNNNINELIKRILSFNYDYKIAYSNNEKSFIMEELAGKKNRYDYNDGYKLTLSIYDRYFREKFEKESYYNFSPKSWIN